jgi:hypothetical protein
MRGALTERARKNRVAVRLRAFEPNNMPSYSARRLATAELQLAAVMAVRIRIPLLYTRGQFAPTSALWRTSSSYFPARAMSASVRNAASLFVHFVDMRFSCGG